MKHASALTERISTICQYAVAFLLSTAFLAALFGVLPSALPTAVRAALAFGGTLLLLALGVRAWPVLARVRLCLPSWWHEHACAALFAIALLIRLLMILLVPVQPISDYELYYQRAVMLENGVSPWDVYIAVVAPNVWAYVTLLSGWMHLFGYSVPVCQLLTALCFSGMTAALYQAARRLLSPEAATLAALWIALSPETVSYSLQIGNEAPALLFLMLGWLLLWEALHCPSNQRCKAAVFAIAAGVLLACCQTIRPIAAFALVPLGLYALMKMPHQEKGVRLRRAVLAGLSVAVCLFALCGLHALRSRVFANALGEAYAQTGQSLGWTLYEGLDIAAKGMWTAEKNDVLQALLNRLPPDRVQPALMELLRERIAGYGVGDWLSLFAVKLGSLWSDCVYLFLSEYRRHLPLTAVAMLCLWAQCALLAGYPLSGVRKEGDAPLALFLPPIMLLSLFCMAGTSISRYHFTALPFIALSLAAMWDASCGQGGRSELRVHCIRERRYANGHRLPLRLW